LSKDQADIGRILGIIAWRGQGKRDGAILEEKSMGNNDIQENIRAEYVALKEHASNTMDRRENILSKNLTFLAALSAFAITVPSTPSIALIFPPISLFFTLEWVGAYETNIIINKYIIHRLTNKLPGIGWEDYFSNWRRKQEKKSRFPSIRKFSRIVIVFPISQVIAIYVGLLMQTKKTINGDLVNTVNFNTDLFNIIAVAFDIVCLFITIYEIKKILVMNCGDLILWQLGRKGGKLSKAKLRDYLGLDIAELDACLNKLKNKGEIEFYEKNNQVIIDKTLCTEDCEESTTTVENPIAPQSSVIDIAGHWIEEGLERDYPELAQKMREGMKK
jgi:hypothetical protein